MIDNMNEFLFERLSFYLNDYSSFITEDMINDYSHIVDFDTREIIIYALADLLKLDNYIVENYLKKTMIELDENVYKSDLYYKNIKLNNVKNNKWSLKYKSYKPYELFVYNDIVVDEKGRMIPQIGYFKEEYEYPVICFNNREWMMITPNEIETMKKPINNAFGNVLTFGLGLGYFAYMASLKENVNSITVVEIDKDAISLFKKYILPQFEHKDKIKIICADAYTFKYDDWYDYVFIDIWHDPSDGTVAYKYFKDKEKEGIKYDYWIEDTIKCYL